MASLNKVILVGNLTRDPELRHTPNGKAVCTIGLAVNRYYKDGQGEKHEEVCFVDCDFWEKQAEAVAQYCTKGRGLLIEGRLQQDIWEDTDTGDKRSKLKVVCENFQFIGAPRQEDEKAVSTAPSPKQFETKLLRKRR